MAAAGACDGGHGVIPLVVMEMLKEVPTQTQLSVRCDDHVAKE